MDALIISLIISLVILFLLYKFAKGVLKILGFVFFITTIVLAIITVFVFIDMNDYRNHGFSNSTMVLVKDESVLAAFKFSSGILPQSLSKDDVQRFDSALKIDDLESIGKQSYKTFFIDYYSLADQEGAQFAQQQLSQQFDSADSQEKKNYLFSALVFMKLKDDPSFIFTGYKDGDIAVYPETAMFLFMKYLPKFVMNKAVFYSSDALGKGDGNADVGRDGKEDGTKADLYIAEDSLGEDGTIAYKKAD